MIRDTDQTQWCTKTTQGKPTPVLQCIVSLSIRICGDSRSKLTELIGQPNQNITFTLQGRHRRFVGDFAFLTYFCGAPILVGDTAEEVVSPSAIRTNLLYYMKYNTIGVVSLQMVLFNLRSAYYMISSENLPLASYTLSL